MSSVVVAVRPRVRVWWWRRLLGLVLVVVVVVSGLGVGGVSVAVAQFDDVDGGGVHAPAVGALAQLGVFEGTECGEGLFCPGEPVLRSTMAVWLVRVLGAPLPDGGGPGGGGSRFVDVDAGVWWAPFVEALADAGVTRGCAVEPARFCPDEAVTRAQMASFLVRAFSIGAASEVFGFEDVDPGGAHAASIDSLAATRITAGCSVDAVLYCPRRPTTRAQMATFLKRARNSFIEACPTEVDEGSGLAGPGGIIGGGGGGGGPVVGVRPVSQATEPQAPGSVRVVPAGDGELSVSWARPADGGSAILNYLVFWGPVIDGEEQTVLGGRLAVSGSVLSRVVDGLVNGTVYEVRVAARNAVAVGPQSPGVEGTPRTKPGAPAVASVDSAPGSLVVEWDPPAGDGGAAVVEYWLRWRPNNGSYGTDPQITDIAPGARSRTVAPLTNGERYFVQVAAVNDAGEGPWSEESSGVPEGLPGAPRSLVASVGDRSIRVEWDPPEDDGGLALIEYRVRWRSRGEQYDASREVRTSDTEADIGVRARPPVVLVNGIAYDVAVAARNSVGWGDSVEERSVVPRTVPDAPQDLVATPAHESIVLEWVPPADNGGDAVDEYLVTWQTGATVRERRVGATGWTIPGLVNGAAYDVAVAAHNGAGGGAAARAGAVPRTVADAPAITAADAGIDQMTLRPRITVRWNPPADNGGDPVSEYRLRWRADTENFTDADWPEDQTAAGLTGTVHTIGDLDPDTGYRIQIASLNDAGQGRWSAERSESTTPAIGSPTSLAATPADTAITLRWAPPDLTGGLTVTGYLVQWKSGTEQFSTTERKHQTGASATGYTIAGLVNGTAYDVAVTTLSTPDNGGAARAGAIVPKTRPGAPQNLRAQPAAHAVNVEWDPPTNNGGDRVTEYTVRWKTANGAFHPDDTQTVTATYKLITELANGTAHDIEVTATNTAGTSTPAQISATTPVTAPDAPADFTVTPGDTQATLAWTASSDDGGADITGHHVRWRSNNQQYNDTDRIDTTLAADATSHTVTGLANGTRRWFQVAAANTQGADNWSTETHTTPRTVPDAPAVTHSSQWEMRWSRPDDGGSDITGYRIRWKNRQQDYHDTDRIADDISASTTRKAFAHLPRGETYKVQVSAQNAAGWGEWSREITAVRATDPGPARNVKVESRTAAVVVTWDPPSSDGGTRIKRYYYWWRANHESYSRGRSGTVSVSANNTDGPFSKQIDNLVKGTRYWVQLGSYHDYANNAPTLSRSASAVALGEPRKPASLDVLARHEALRVVWEAPDDRGAKITGYKVQWKTGDDDFNSPVEVAASARSYDITPLDNGTLYDVSVVAENSVGDSEAATGAATPVQATVPHAPGLSIEPRNLGLRATWEPPDNDGGAEITGYKIQWKTGDDDFNSPVEVGASVRLYEITQLLNDTVYTVRVTATNFVGDAAADADASPLAPIVPGAPANVRFELLHLGFRVLWDLPTEDGRAPITGYRLVWGNGMTSNSVDLTERSHDLTGLDLWRTYPVRVHAVNSAGEGAAAIAAGRPGHIPGPPGLPRLHSEDGRLTITWYRNYTRWIYLGHHGTQVTSFRVQWKAAGQEYDSARQTEIDPVRPVGPQLYQQDETRYSHTIEGLANGTSYTVRVTPINGHMEGAPIEIEGAPTAIADGAPASLSLYSTQTGNRINNLYSSTEFRAQWQPASLSGETLDSYRVQHKEAGQPDSAFVSQSVRGTSAELEGLNAGTEYTVRVAAVLPEDEEDEYGAATEITRLAQTRPSKPSNFQITPGDRSVVLTWDPPTDAGSGNPVRIYRVVFPGLVDLHPDQQSYTITGLTNGVSVTWISIAAQNGYGGSKVSAQLAHPGTVPGVVQELSLVPGDTALAVSWQPPASDGGRDIISYRVRWKGSGEDYHSDRETVITDGGTDHSVTGLTNAAEYSVEVVADNDLGTGPAQELQATPGAVDDVPAAPSDLAALAGDAALTVSWSQPAGGTVEVSGHRVRWKGPGEGYHSDRETVITDGSTHYSIDGLVNGTSYHVAVAATSTAGDSAAATIRQTPVTVPSAVRDTIIRNRSPITSRQITATALMSWLAPEDDGGAPVEHYRVVKESDGTFDTADCSPDITEAVDLHHIADFKGTGTHRWQISAVNSAGAGPAVEVEVTVP